MAIRLRGIDLVQPCFQTLDGKFADRGPQGEAASCACIGSDSGSDLEIDAIHPDTLRQIERDAIDRRVDFEQLEILRLAEREKRA